MNDENSPNKRPCPDSGDIDSGDLPNLQDLFKELCKPEESSPVSEINESIQEETLCIKPSDRLHSMKTYSSVHRKSNSSHLPAPKSDDTKFENLLKSNKVALNSTNNKNEAKTNLSTEKHNSKVQANVLTELNNICSKVQAEQCIVQENQSIKAKDSCNNESTLIDARSKSKKNVLRKSPAGKKNKLRRKSQNNILQHKNNKNALTNLVSSNVNASNNMIQEIVSTTLPAVKDSSKNNSYTLNQATLCHSKDINKDSAKKQTDDPFKYIGLFDTAVSVDCVTSPLGAKSLTVQKCPGWTRIEREKKEFKIKTFTSLDIEKNSMTATVKSATKCAAVSDQAFNINRSENVLNVTAEGKNDVSSSKHEEDNSEIIADEHFAYKDNREADYIPKNVNFQTEPVKDCNFQYVDQSQQTSQVVSLDFHNPIHDNSRELIIPNHEVSPFGLNTEKADKTKVLKRTCLTLEEIQESFFKSTQNDCSETLCYLPFSSSRFKLHIAVSEETLNVSILRVILLDVMPVHSIANFDLIVQSDQRCPRVKTEQTKVVKRVCLTLEEIEDSFIESSQTGCSKLLYCLPFCSGHFKLHIAVSDETLNVSVFRPFVSLELVSAPDIPVPPCDESNTSNTLFTSTKIVPYSYGSSEPNSVTSTSPDQSVDPFLYLNKKPDINKNISLASEHKDETELTVVETNLKDEAVAIHDVQVVNESSKNCFENKYEDEYDDLECSEIIHLPLKCHNVDMKVKKGVSIENENQVNKEDSCNLPQSFSPLCSSERSLICMKDDYPMNKDDVSSLLPKTDVSSNVKEIDLMSADSHSDESLRNLQKLKQCVRKQEKPLKLKKSRLSLSKKSFRRIKLQDSSEESDSETSQCVKDPSIESANETSSKLKNPKVANLVKDKSFQQTEENQMELTREKDDRLSNVIEEQQCPSGSNGIESSKKSKLHIKIHSSLTSNDA